MYASLSTFPPIHNPALLEAVVDAEPTQNDQGSLLQPIVIALFFSYTFFGKHITLTYGKVDSAFDKAYR